MIPLAAAAGVLAAWAVWEAAGLPWREILAASTTPELGRALETLGWGFKKYVLFRILAALAGAAAAAAPHPLLAPLGAYALWRSFPRAVMRSAERRREGVEAALPGFCEEVAVRLSAGARLADAVCEAALRAREPLGRELSRIASLADTDPLRIPEEIRRLGEGLGMDARLVLDRLARAFETGAYGPGIFEESAESLRRLWAERERARTRTLPLEMLAGAAAGVFGLAAAGFYLLAMWAVETARSLAAF